MTNIKSIIPNYYEQFQCIGASCPKSCCNGWNITVDKKTYKNLKKNSNKAFKEIAARSLIHIGEEPNFGQFKLDSCGNCKFLDNQGWCSIHNLLGEKHLPKVCRVYPRSSQAVGNRLERTLQLSCPEAARLILTEANGLQIKYTEQCELSIEDPKAPDPNRELPAWIDFLRDFCLKVINQRQLTIGERLFIIGLTLQNAEKHLNDKHVVSVVGQIKKMMADKSIIGMYNEVPVRHDLGYLLFSSIDSALVDIKQNGSKGRTELSDDELYVFSHLKGLHKALLSETEHNTQKFDKSLGFEEFNSAISKAMLTGVEPFLEANEQLVVNYLSYFIYHYKFHMAGSFSPSNMIKQAAIHLLMIRYYLAGVWLTKQELTVEDFIGVVTSFESTGQHNTGFIKHLLKLITQIDEVNPYLLFSMLK